MIVPIKALSIVLLTQLNPSGQTVDRAQQSKLSQNTKEGEVQVVSEKSSSTKRLEQGSIPAVQVEARP